MILGYLGRWLVTYPLGLLHSTDTCFSRAKWNTYTRSSEPRALKIEIEPAYSAAPYV